jgi:hypothetical protein
MRFVAGSKAISEHAEAGKDLYLFSESKRSHLQFMGQFVCSGHHTRRGRDIGGSERTAIVFELLPLEDFSLEHSLGGLGIPRELQYLDLAALRPS